LLFNFFNPVMCNFEIDLPVWEIPSLPAPGKRALPQGYISYLTWQSRSVLLLPEENNNELIVKKMLYAQGISVEDNWNRDPLKSYKKNKEKGRTPVRLAEDRALWRDSGSLFELIDDNPARPASFNWLARLVQEGSLDREKRYHYHVFGLCADQAKVELWRHERIPLPLSLLVDESLVGDLRTALSRAEDVAREGIGTSAWNLAGLLLSPDENRKPDRKQRDKLIQKLAMEELFWPSLELPFKKFVEDLGNGDKEALNKWFQTLKRSAIKAFDESVNSMGMTARTLKAANHVSVRGNFYGKLKKVLPELFNENQTNITKEVNKNE